MANKRNVFFYYHPNFEEQVSILRKLAIKYDFTVVEHHEDASIIASVGGDGAFLHAVRRTGFRDDCLYAGISIDDKRNRLYCDFSMNDLESSLHAVLNKEIEVRKYPVIDVLIDQETSFHCLNEVSIRSSIIRTLVIDVMIDDLHFETFRGDGMIIAPPTGSTAYNKSVSGAVVDPLLPCFQVSEIASINNNRYRTLGSSFILSGERTLTLRPNADDSHYPIIGMDNEALSIQHIEEIKVRLSEKHIKTVKLKNNSFWEKVKRTFL